MISTKAYQSCKISWTFVDISCIETILNGTYFWVVWKVRTIEKCEVALLCFVCPQTCCSTQHFRGYPADFPRKFADWILNFDGILFWGLKLFKEILIQEWILTFQQCFYYYFAICSNIMTEEILGNPRIKKTFSFGCEVSVHWLICGSLSVFCLKSKIYGGWPVDVALAENNPRSYRLVAQGKLWITWVFHLSTSLPWFFYFYLKSFSSWS